MGSLHGYGIARRIEQVSGNEVLLNQGTIYASLVRLEQRGWISSRWGTSDNNRKAKFYSITAAGRRQLTADARYWERLKDVMERVMTMDDSAKGERTHELALAAAGHDVGIRAQEASRRGPGRRACRASGDGDRRQHGARIVGRGSATGGAGEHRRNGTGTLQTS